MINAPILDYLIRIKNAYKAGQKNLEVPSSRFKVAVSNLLQKHGFIENYTVKDEDKKAVLKVTLKYLDKQPALSSVKIYSRPGRRIYHRVDSLPWGDNRTSLILVSTSKGVISQSQAKKLNMGGEVIAQIN